MEQAPDAVGPAMRDYRHCLRNDGMTMTGAAPAVLLPESSAAWAACPFGGSSRACPVTSLQLGESNAWLVGFQPTGLSDHGSLRLRRAPARRLSPAFGRQYIRCSAARHNPGMAPSLRPWFLYLLECRDGSYYAGISTDVDARFAAHQAGKGARYTRARPPLRVLAVREYPDRAAASRAEWQLKQQPRERKLAWLQAVDAGSL